MSIPLPEPVGFRVRVRSEPGMIGHYPWTYCDARRRERTPRQDCEYDDLHTADQMHAHAAAVSAAKDARIRELEDALRMALAELDELPVWSNTGHVCNAARAALGDKNG